MVPKYAILIIDGAAGWPLVDRGNKTSLELACTPNLDAISREGHLGLTNNVPPGMEPSSAIACMSLLGYNPEIYYRGRAAIEAISMGVGIDSDEAIFRCNLVAIKAGSMWSYCAGHISDTEARELIGALNAYLGSDEVCFYPGVGYRHLLKIKGHPEVERAICIPPHDIPGKPITNFLPQGDGSNFLRKLMKDAEAILHDHHVNLERIARGAIPATAIWLFWGSGAIPHTPPFKEKYGLSAALTSGVDLLRGLGLMMGMTILDIPGVTDNLDNDFAAQAQGALAALEQHDLTVIHIEAPDEAGHSGKADEKITAIEKADALVVSRLRRERNLRLLVLPDHPTPIPIQTHAAEPVPFLMWGPGFATNGGQRFTESEARRTGISIANGYNILEEFVR
ncbi:MAG: cofactor-independent phosphoglycerate mutase [Dehalococcoidia bacterium]|nr:cofactor-independent phosphoglycerate mutase [Dehalococcoidia bacterium]